MSHPTPHEGEIRVQERAGQRAVAMRNGAMISSAVPSDALPFLSRQRIVAAGSLDDDERLWASVWLGEAGFASSADGRVVTLRRALDADDPVRRGVRAGRSIGLLAIDFETRRRLRINGIVASVTDDAVDVEVREAYPNCPKHIRRRRLSGASRPPSPLPPALGTALDEERRSRIVRADTVFVASLHPERGVDASHRGGEPGFVEVVDARTIRVPDYAGNGLFQTLGNFEVDARASVAVVDFDGGRVLSLSGRAANVFEGASRRFELRVERWTEIAMPPSLRWERLDAAVPRVER
jgi:uncharacterized protein